MTSAAKATAERLALQAMHVTETAGAAT